MSKEGSKMIKEVKTPFQKCDFNFTTFKIAVNHIPPFCIVKRKKTLGTTTSQLQIVTSIEPELLKLLEKKFHFRSAFVDARQSWGMELDNGTWDGVVGKVLYKKADFAICDISFSTKRFKVIDFASIIYYNEVTALSHSSSRRLNRVNTALFMTPFPASVWLLTLISAIGILILLKAFNRKYNLMATFRLKLVGILLKQSMTVICSRAHNSERLLLATWMITSLILSTVYCTLFFALITVPQYERPIDTREDLLRVAQSDSHFLLTRGHSAFQTMFIYARRNQNSLFYEIGRHMNRTKQKMIVDDESEIEVAERSPRNVILATRMFLIANRFLEATKPLHIARDVLVPDFMSFLLPKKSTLRRPFNIVIKRVREMGLFDKWTVVTLSGLQSKSRLLRNSYLYEPLGHFDRVNRTPEDFSSLNLENVYSIFIVWSGGVAVSLACFIFYDVLYFCLVVRPVLVV